MNEPKLIPTHPTLKTKKHGNKIESKIEKINELNLYLQKIKSDLDYLTSKYIQEIQAIEIKLIQIEAKEIMYLDSVFESKSLSNRDNKLLSEIILTKISDIIAWFQSNEIQEIKEKHLNFYQKYKKQESDVEHEIEEINPSNEQQTILHESQEIATGSRKIYLELVKKFHPDLSCNPVQEKTNTDIMQEVTAAYQEKDWIKLINLKSKLLQSEESIRQTDEDLLKILDKNLASLEEEINAIKDKGNQFFPENKLFDKDFPKRRLSIDILLRSRSKELTEILKTKKNNLPAYGKASQVEAMLGYYRKMS